MDQDPEGLMDEAEQAEATAQELETRNQASGKQNEQTKKASEEPQAEAEREGVARKNKTSPDEAGEKMLEEAVTQGSLKGLTGVELTKVLLRNMTAALPRSSPVVREIATQVRADMFVVPNVRPGVVVGPTLELRRSGASSRDILESDVTRQLLRRPFVLGTVPTEQQGSVLLQDLAAAVGRAGAGTAFGPLIAYATRLATEAQAEEALGGVMGIPPEVRNLKVVEGVAYDWTLLGARTFLTRFPSSELLWFEAVHAGGEIPVQELTYPVPPSLFVGDGRDNADLLLVAWVTVLSMSGQLRFAFCGINLPWLTDI